MLPLFFFCNIKKYTIAPLQLRTTYINSFCCKYLIVKRYNYNAEFKLNPNDLDYLCVIKRLLDYGKPLTFSTFNVSLKEYGLIVYNNNSAAIAAIAKYLDYGFIEQVVGVDKLYVCTPTFYATLKKLNYIAKDLTTRPAVSIKYPTKIKAKKKKKAVKKGVKK